jgi:hypothetical protein
MFLHSPPYGQLASLLYCLSACLIHSIAEDHHQHQQAGSEHTDILGKAFGYEIFGDSVWWIFRKNPVKD